MENQTASHALPKIDIYDLDTYAKGVPHADFTELRAHAPVSFHGEPGGRGFWVISKYSDVVDISKNPRDFSSARGGTNIPDYAEEDLSQIQLLMVNMDPPQHARFRKLVARGFTPRIVQLMEPKIRAEVDEILNEVIAKGTGACDFVRDIAAELPLRVIAELLGVPREDRQKIFDWSNQLIGFDDPEFQTSIEDARQSAMEIWMYANSLAEDRLDKDGTDLISVLINSEIDGEKLSEMEFDAFFLLLSVAGNETTRNALSGGMLALLQNPDQMALMRSNPELISQAVEETLRWVTPVNHFRRTVTRDLEVRGVPMKENDKVVIFYCSANRDEEVFADPFKFDITRNPNPHLAFGVGEHFCMGASLARLEMRILFEQLIARMDDIELAGDVRLLRSNFINGIKTMPITFRGV